jgi:hypothetical protein
MDNSSFAGKEVGEDNGRAGANRSLYVLEDHDRGIRELIKKRTVGGRDPSYSAIVGEALDRFLREEGVLK